MKIAKGKYIAVMDGDDIAMPERLEKQVEIMESDDSLLAHGTAFIFSSGQTSHIPYSYELLKVTLMQNNMLLHPSLIIRKKTVAEVGYYNERYYFSSDYDLVCKIAQKGKIINIPDILMKYRLHKNQISSVGEIRQTAFAEKIRLEYMKMYGFRLLKDEKKIFTRMMTCPENINIADAVVIADKIKKQNHELNHFNHVILDKFLKRTLSKTSQYKNTGSR
jgi:glycosyltransferase involved in cell wall biosynthesis